MNRVADEADVDVVVVGAGPTGLLAAAELALGRVMVQVIERLAEPDPMVKACSVNVATYTAERHPPRPGGGRAPG